MALDGYGQSIALYTNDQSPNLESMIANLATGTIPRSIMRFTSATSRGATITAPVEGMVSWLQDVNRLYVYNGSAWTAVAPVQQTGSVSLSFTNQDNYSATAVTFPVAFAAAPRVFVNITSGGGSTTRWQARAITISTTGFTPFVFASTAGLDSTWSGIEVQWHAIAP